MIGQLIFVIISKKHRLFSASKITKNLINRNFVYNGYEIAFNGPESWSLSNYFAGNVVIFGIGNSSWIQQ